MTSQTLTRDCQSCGVPFSQEIQRGRPGRRRTKCDGCRAQPRQPRLVHYAPQKDTSRAMANNALRGFMNLTESFTGIFLAGAEGLITPGTPEHSTIHGYPKGQAIIYETDSRIAALQREQINSLPKDKRDRVMLLNEDILSEKAWWLLRAMRPEGVQVAGLDFCGGATEPTVRGVEALLDAKILAKPSLLWMTFSEAARAERYHVIPNGEQADYFQDHAIKAGYKRTVLAGNFQYPGQRVPMTSFTLILR